MSRRTRFALAVALAFAGALIAVLVSAGGDGNDDSCGDSVACSTAAHDRNLGPGMRGDASTAKSGIARRPADAAAARDEREATGPNAGRQATEEGPSGPAPSTDPERQASDAVGAFLAALDARDGQAVCNAFAEAALYGTPFPRTGRTCASTVERSLGYRDPRGLPVWRSSKPTGEISAQVDGARARVTATVLTDYADQRDASVEDDVLYLARVGNRWLLEKPSATFYRAIGVADVPIDVFKPPD